MIRSRMSNLNKILFSWKFIDKFSTNHIFCEISQINWMYSSILYDIPSKNITGEKDIPTNIRIKKFAISITFDIIVKQSNSNYISYIILLQIDRFYHFSLRAETHSSVFFICYRSLLYRSVHIFLYSIPIYYNIPRAKSFKAKFGL